jgi:hypothetical protein
MFIDEPQVQDDTLQEIVEDEPAETEAEETQQEVNWEEEAKKWKAIAARHAKKQEKTPSPEGGLNEYDILALKNSNISEKEDLDTVKEYARKLNLSIAEALEDKYVRTVLHDKAEERRTARATETRSPRGISKASGDDMLRKAEREGDLPDTQEGLQALVEARLERKRK